jgi:hypothetical protein
VESVPPQPGQPQPGQPQRRAVAGGALTGGCYAVLFLLGIGEGVVGAFQYSRGIGQFPAAALGFDVLILATCVLAAWGMRAPSAGLMPAAGWFAASFVLAMSTPGGSIVITNTTAGKWFLFGGAACAAAGVVAGFVTWSAPRAPRTPRSGQTAWSGVRPWKPGP